MKLTLSILPIAIFAGVHAMPNPVERDDVQTVHLTFHGGPASYEMTFPADGKTRQTNSDINVNIIDAPDYNAFSQCTFTTNGEKTLVQSIDSDGSQHIIVGPPQVITAVSCQGFCVPTYGECYDSNGQPVGPCCNGFCAADRCRPWSTATSSS
ncbi:hypothetical protein FSOLCH5_004771 [Fusarium solani]|uniref:SSCRP protein n=1 Tax=Fusarium solani TaxID=169388 RepID=A0A9P9GD98_FUSSL|nr:uncharacterized protein B0J15DRAFT_503839 [Fusarium solani]KAH7237423.1 hypothetical protein B0J15DRAFT_503839 [Fusarium solani]KAJ3466761.1 hypothetical protein MRS44_004325 [Fusarium solani]KAJ4199563.1 hypothetical protein NW759_016073 [Fusarium solani]